MTKTIEAETRRSLTRRELLARAAVTGAFLAIGPGFIAATDGAWAAEVKVLKPATMASLVQMARDIYPHDQVADSFYVIAVKGYDSEDHKDATESGIAVLDALARSKGFSSYLETGWERDRVAMLREISGGSFFQTVRGGLVTGLYNQKAIWPIFGYEGASFEQGGYIDRGFDDINWL